jgi:glycosyltransferase involved in cell wall biosynthesis
MNRIRRALALEGYLSLTSVTEMTSTRLTMQDEDESNRIRLLVSAYACEPGKGSEQGVGWHIVLELSRYFDLWIITRANNRTIIESSLQQLPLEQRSHLHFVYYDLPRPLLRMKHQGRFLYLYYIAWQVGAFRIASELVHQRKFDLSMHLTFGSMWLPTFIHKLPVPFIWGPVGGAEAVPPPALSALPALSRIAQSTRYLLIRLARFNPLVRGPARAAVAIIARTTDTANVLRPLASCSPIVMLETGLAPLPCATPSSAASPNTRKEIVFTYSGRLVPTKNVRMAISALDYAIRKGLAAQLRILGDGHQLGALRAMAASLGLSDRVHFFGRVSQFEVAQHLLETDVFLFPSLKEGGSWSLMEAMSAALPIICVKTSGVSVMTDDSCAIRVPPALESTMVSEMGDAMVFLGHSPTARIQMGTHARRRVEETLLWRTKGERMRDLLERLVNRATAATSRR